MAKCFIIITLGDFCLHPVNICDTLYIYKCVYVCICMCVYVYVCDCVWNSESQVETKDECVSYKVHKFPFMLGISL